jgi:hypothetical protein
MKIFFGDSPAFRVDFKAFAFFEHLFDKILSADKLQMTYSAVLVTVFRAILGINILTRIHLYLKLMIAALQGACHYHCNDFGIVVLVCLILYVYIFRLGPLAYAVSVLTMFRAIFGNMNSEEDLAAPWILAFLFAKFLAPAGLG